MRVTECRINTIDRFSVTIIVYSGKDHEPVHCQYGSKQIMLSLIGYQFDRVITEERRRLLGIVQGRQDTPKCHYEQIQHRSMILAYVYKFLYSEVFNQPKVVEQAKAMLRKSDTLYYGVKGASMIKWVTKIGVRFILQTHLCSAPSAEILIDQKRKRVMIWYLYPIAQPKPLNQPSIATLLTMFIWMTILRNISIERWINNILIFHLWHIIG